MERGEGEKGESNVQETKSQSDQKPLFSPPMHGLNGSNGGSGDSPRSGKQPLPARLPGPPRPPIAFLGILVPATKINGGEM